MIIGSHDTMTYLHDRRWWMRPFECFGRCQSRSLVEQVNLGVRYFDFRVNFDDKGKPYFAHGLAKYELVDFVSVDDAINYVAEYARNTETKVYIRILLESIKEPSEERKTFFAKFCHEQQRLHYGKYVRLRFGVKNPWEIFYDDFDVKFVETAKHFDIKWHAVIPIKLWKWEQDRIQRAINDTGFRGIVAQDFV